MNKNLIINADDFGYSQVINKAIIYSLERGIINSASLMTTMPGFQEAVEMVKMRGYTRCIGVHVNLTEGKPLTKFKHRAFLNEDGTWNKDVIIGSRFGFSKEIRKDFSKEIIAQVRAAEKMGIQPAHINSHHHVHTLPAFFYLFLNVSRAHGYKLRIAQTHFSGSFLKTAYRKYINSLIRRHGLQFSEYFETVQSYQQRKKNNRGGVTEIMVHPTFDEQGVLVDELNKNNGGAEYQEFYNRFK